MGMQPIPRPPLGHNPRQLEEKDLDDATEREHRSREIAGRPDGRGLRRLLAGLTRRRARG